RSLKQPRKSPRSLMKNQIMANFHSLFTRLELRRLTLSVRRCANLAENIFRLRLIKRLQNGADGKSWHLSDQHYVELLTAKSTLRDLTFRLHDALSSLE